MAESGSPSSGPPSEASSSAGTTGAPQARASKSLIRRTGFRPSVPSSSSETRHGELVRSMAPSVTGPATAMTPEVGLISQPSTKAFTPLRKVGWSAPLKLSWCSSTGLPLIMWAMAKRALVPPTSPTRSVLSQAMVIRFLPLEGASGVDRAVDEIGIGLAVVPGGVAGGGYEADRGALLGRRDDVPEGAEQLAAIAPGRAARM